MNWEEIQGIAEDYGVEAIKPCPFCGETEFTADRMEENIVFLQCSTEQCGMGLMVEYSDFYYEDEDSVISLYVYALLTWNTRRSDNNAEIQQTKKQLAEAERMRHPLKKIGSADMPVIQARYLAGESSREIGLSYGVSPATITNHLHKMKVPIRDKYEESARLLRKRYDEARVRRG